MRDKVQVSSTLLSSFTSIVESISPLKIAGEGFIVGLAYKNSALCGRRPTLYICCRRVKEVWLKF